MRTPVPPTSPTARPPAGRHLTRLRFRARPEYLVLVRLALTGIAAAEHISAVTLADLKLAVSEACTNAIEHGYPDWPDRTDAVVEVSFAVEDTTLTVDVVDRGRGFDAEMEVASFTDGSSDHERGMGLAIIRSVTDELSVFSTEHGSRVRFSKRLEGRYPPANT